MAPIGALLAKTGITPNMMTILSLLVAIISGYSYAIREITVGALLIVVAGVLDMMDGAIARARES
jgi:phosphatidylglycerophosphate synthase